MRTVGLVPRSVMQTFLPFKSYKKSAAVLDDRRLGKQRVETLQIMLALVDNKGWVNHPATKMWKGYEFSLLYYQNAVCKEWHIVRGFEDSCFRKTAEIFWEGMPWMATEVCIPPWWLGEKDFHLSHRSNLVRKDPTRYSKIFPKVPDNLPYVWPVS